MNRVALIPAYEPGQVLIELADELVAENFSVVIIDDGSGPDYKEVFDRLKDTCNVIQYKKNSGKGYALKVGLKYINKYYENATIVTMDSDGQHLVSDAERLCTEVEENPGTFVIGSRVLPKDAPTKSRLGNGITRQIFKKLTGVGIYDTQSGLRAFSQGWIPSLLEISGDRYEYEMNVLLYLAENHLPVKELPIKTIYFDKKNSVSHFNAVTDSIRIYSQIFKFAGSSFASFLVDYAAYSLLLLTIFSGNLLAANYLARAISSLFNFFVNKKLVFKSKGNLRQEATKYFCLVIVIISVNSGILLLLAKLGANVFVAKIIVELIMFVINYFIQHRFIFRKERPCAKSISLQ